MHFIYRRDEFSDSLTKRNDGYLFTLKNSSTTKQWADADLFMFRGFKILGFAGSNVWRYLALKLMWKELSLMSDALSELKDHETDVITFQSNFKMGTGDLSIFCCCCWLLM